MGYLDKAGLSRAFTKLKTLIDNKADVGHTHTKNQVGLGNVDNTADSTKSVKYASSAGSASKCNNVIYTHQNEINFSGGKQPTCYFNYRNADSDASDGGTTGITYKFCNYTANTAYSTVEANNFVGKINGNTVSKSVPADANFSNDKVAQTAVKNTDYSDWRSLVWGASHSSTEGFTPTSVTDNLFRTNTLSVQPSTGTIKATTFKGNLSGKATSAGSADRAIEVADYNNTNQGIKIGYAGDGFKSTDFQYALGMNNDRKIKDVSQGEYRKWLGLGSAAYTSSGAYAASNHTHNYAGSRSSGGDADWAKGADFSDCAFSNNGVSTSGNGSAYTATVSGFSLGTGKSIVMIPNVTSTTTTPTLNVSGTGAKNIRMRLSSSTSSTIPLIRSDFLTQYKPVKVTYDGTYWVIDDFIQPDANNLYGTLISRGSSAPSSGTAGFIYIQTT